MHTQQAMKQIIDHKFEDQKLLEEALVAAGADAEPPINDTKRQGNQRLALIGDAVLRLILVDDGIVSGKTTGMLQPFLSAGDG
ncbi:Ribonuclease III [Fusarium albosuccineum]|uniref:Ribonuclease III n=1 Tax=Fusarium albosuccineum TaxID=1237068 RepID=A0A8H4LDC9_9HYPO|nr:Ribonuclease III [Fusarium albosuccineum]